MLSRIPPVRRSAPLALAVFVVGAGIGALIIALVTGGTRSQRPLGDRLAHPFRVPSTANPPPRPPPSFAVGLRVLRLVDPRRTIPLPNGSIEQRTLQTYVRYPALGPAGGTDLRNAPAARIDGPFPLVIFGHGFSVTPGLYAHLLQTWTRAGYVVAAPLFPLGNANAPGGPDESDLVNQPMDMRFVISQLLAISSDASSPLAGLIDPKAIAVSGHSDGGDTALAAAYNRYYRDRRITAAAILSGAEIPGMGGYTFPPGSPPLLATQGTADTINTPAETELFFEAASRPKYLLRLLGAEHLPPYRDEQPQLRVIERVTIAFFDAYLKHKPGALRRLVSAGHVPGIASLLAYP
jgi:dienelactone hydrolase